MAEFTYCLFCTNQDGTRSTISTANPASMSIIPARCDFIQGFPKTSEGLEKRNAAIDLWLYPKQEYGQ